MNQASYQLVLCLEAAEEWSVCESGCVFVARKPYQRFESSSFPDGDNDDQQHGSCGLCAFAILIQEAFTLTSGVRLLYDSRLVPGVHDMNMIGNPSPGF